MTARLPVRLFASYVLVVAVGAATVFLVVRLLAPPLFDHSMRRADMGMGGMRVQAGGGRTPRSCLR